MHKKLLESRKKRKNMKLKHPTALVILDGFGYHKNSLYNAISQAKKPNLDAWFSHYPHALLKASGHAVGLLDNYMGNSEVGHMTIGAGRIVQQPISLIHDAIIDKSFFKNPVLVEKLAALKKSGDALHIMGLVSDGGVHSDIEHLYAFLDAAHQHGIKYVYIHAFLDGRDTPPRSAMTYLNQLDQALTLFEFGSIGSLHGRFYAMDRDKNWDRTEKSYRILTENQDTPQCWQDALEKQYAQGTTDEFFIPTQLDPTSTIQQGDGVIFFNIRADRARQLAAAFVDPIFNYFPVKKLNLSFFMTPVPYASDLKTDVLYKPVSVNNVLEDVLAGNNKTIFSIAETEKYAHVTYFFNGGREQPTPTETRILIPSIKSHDYINNPEMRAREITDAVLASLTSDPKDFYLINYANADMVGHSGNLAATVAAIECLDSELKRLYDQVVERMNGTLYITADHGNAEEMIDPATHEPKTSHTTNPVPFIMLQKGISPSMKLPLCELSDIAPFILRTMGLDVPEEMTRLD